MEGFITCAIDIDDQATWPESVLSAVKGLARQLVGTTGYTADLAIDPEQEDEFRLELTGHTIRAYHATRLLPHEIEHIKKHGLRRLGNDLVSERLNAARAHGFLSEEEATELREGSVLAVDGDGQRFGSRQRQVCLFLSVQTFSDQGGLWRLFATWGGEAIYWLVDKDSELERRLQTLGQPALVVAQLDRLHEGWRTHPVWPSLAKVFVGAFLSLNDRGASIHYGADISGSAIEDIWLPGHPPFQQHLFWTLT